MTAPCQSYVCQNQWLRRHGYHTCADADGINIASNNDAASVNIASAIVRQLLRATQDTRVSTWLRSRFWIAVSPSGVRPAAASYYDFGEGVSDGCVPITNTLGYALASTNRTQHVLSASMQTVLHGVAHYHPVLAGVSSFRSVIGQATLAAEEGGFFHGRPKDCTEASCVVPLFAQRILEDRLNVSADYRFNDYRHHFTHIRQPNVRVQAGVDAMVYLFNMHTIGFAGGSAFDQQNYTTCSDIYGAPQEDTSGVRGTEFKVVCQYNVMARIIVVFLFCAAFISLCRITCARKKNKEKSRKGSYAKVAPSDRSMTF